MISPLIPVLLGCGSDFIIKIMMMAVKECLSGDTDRIIANRLMMSGLFFFLRCIFIRDMVSYSIKDKTHSPVSLPAKKAAHAAPL